MAKIIPPENRHAHAKPKDTGEDTKPKDTGDANATAPTANAAIIGYNIRIAPSSKRFVGATDLDEAVRLYMHHEGIIHSQNAIESSPVSDENDRAALSVPIPA